MQNIQRYYLLCTIQNGGKSHIVDELPNKKLEVIYTKKEISLFLREKDGHYIAREIIVGGKQERQPIIIIM